MPELDRFTVWIASIQFQQIGEHLIDVALPFRDVGDGENGVDAVVPSGINGLHEETVHFENAKDVAIFDDALSQTNSVVPHVGSFLVEWQSVERVEFHDVACAWIQCEVEYGTACQKVSIQLVFPVFFLHESCTAFALG